MALAVGILIGGILLLSERNQRRFLEKFRSDVNTNPQYIAICEFARGAATEGCHLFVGNELSALLHQLSLARAKMSPGKVPIVRERMLKIGKGDPSLKEYIGCYRLVNFRGFDNAVFVNQIQPDGTCTRIVRYLPGCLEWYEGASQ